MEATAQMNVRLSRTLKAAGDAALAEAGITPTELIRELWEKISHGAADVMQVQELLTGQSSSNTVALSSESSSAADTLVRGRALFDAGLVELGIKGTALVQNGAMTDAETYAEALLERMRERGV
ncbi:MAG: hypothetical protein Q4A07_13070 [Coriobacteriales bacterium]|nr:hypothetical protein [Coriobacteriales bacterium]